MSKYKYEGFGVIRNTETYFQYHTDDIAELLKEKDQQIDDLEEKLAEKEKTIQAYEKIVEQKDEETRFANRNKIYIVKQLNDPKDYVLLEDYKKVEQQLAEKDKDNQFFKKMYLSERTKNNNYHTEKFGLDKPVEELRKIKLTPKEKEIYYKGFDNCERQFATQIAELEQQLQSQPAEIVEKIRDLAGDYFYENSKEDLLLTGSDFTEILDTILKEYQK